MPNVNPGAPVVAPGVPTGSQLNQYPQWGIGGGTPGSSAGWKTVEAKNAAQKNAFIGQGFDIWFTSQAAAQSFLSTEENPVASGQPQNAIPGLSSIGDFFQRLTQANTWIRIAKAVVGGALVLIGLAHMTGASDAISSAARKVPLPV